MAETQNSAEQFFKVMHQHFEQIIAEHRGSESLLSALLTQAFGVYEQNADLQSESMPEPDCHKGCATCCTIRVVATAPEVFLVARYLESVKEQLAAQGIDVQQRLKAADELTRGHDEQERVELHRRCPYIHQGVCFIYPVRPLACRSHLSFSKQACIDAAKGELDEIPYSEAHMNLRSLVQNAMQSALRDANYPWATYELNHALIIALENNQAEQAWLSGEDLLEPAMVKEVSLDEMAEAFDEIFH